LNGVWNSEWERSNPFGPAAPATAKRFKRIALRCEKTAQNYGSFVTLALGLILMNPSQILWNVIADRGDIPQMAPSAPAAGQIPRAQILNKALAAAPTSPKNACR
jgi:hypothetical protein